MQIHGALLALRTGRPVKIVYNRQESFVGHIHRHPARIWCEHRATRAGKLVNVRMRILLDGGAYASSSTAVTSNAASFALGPYAVENALIESTCVYTNNPPCGAMRGFGAVQTCFAGEAQLDKLAAELGIDPVELRLLNALAPGDVLPTGQSIEGSLPVAEVIRRAAALPVPEAESLPREAIRLPGGAGNTTRGEGRSARGRLRRRLQEHLLLRGLRRLDGRARDPARRRLRGDPLRGRRGRPGRHRRDPPGRPDRARHRRGRARRARRPTSVASAGSASASRMTWMAAGAVQLACRAALDERERAGGGEVDVERIYRHSRTTPLDPETGQITGERAHVAFAVAAMRVVVEVDVELGLTRVVWIGTAQDVGKAVNPLAVEGQIEGGTAQGLGLALMEEIQTRDGLITNASFTDYLIPTTLDMPPVESVLVEDPEPGRALRRQGRRRAADGRLDGRGRLRASRRDRPRADARARAAGRHRRPQLEALRHDRREARPGRRPPPPRDPSSDRGRRAPAPPCEALRAVGIPNRSRVPCTTSRGTETASSSGRRLGDAGEPARGGGCSGKARQSTPTASRRSSGAAGHACARGAAAHDERQPTKRGRTQLLDHFRPGGVELMCGRRRAAAGDAVGLLDERDADAYCARGLRHSDQIRSRHPSTGSVTENEPGDRLVGRVQVHVRPPVLRLDREDRHPVSSCRATVRRRSRAGRRRSRAARSARPRPRRRGRSGRSRPPSRAGPRSGGRWSRSRRAGARRP